MNKIFFFICLCASFSHIFCALPPHLEFVYDLDNLPVLTKTLVQPYVSAFFNNFPIGSDNFTFNFTLSKKNYTFTFSNIELRNLIIDWNDCKITPCDDNSLNLSIKNVTSSVYFNYLLSQGTHTIQQDASTPFILNLTVTNIIVNLQFIPTTANSLGFISQINILDFTLANMTFSSNLTHSVTNWPLFGELFINQTASFKQQLQMIILLRTQLIVTTFMAQTIVLMHQAATDEQFVGDRLTVDLRIIGCPQINKTGVGNSTKYILTVPADFSMGWTS